MLTEKQQNVYDVFLHMIKEKQNYLLSSENRGIGKTYTINELGFELQFLGHKVFVLALSNVVEYFAECKISNDIQDFKSRLTDNSVVLVDEAKREMMDELLDYCEYRKIPVVGYVDFSIRLSYIHEKFNNKELFEREYKCSWGKF